MLKNVFKQDTKLFKRDTKSYVQDNSKSPLKFWGVVFHNDFHCFVNVIALQTTITT